MENKVKTERIGVMNSKNQADLLEQAKTLPRKPGCYLMKNKDQQIIYVGKAKDLKARVSSYFQMGAKTPKTEILVGHIREFDFLITNSDAEAFVLENNLIKKHTPKYNIRLKDDKSYPYVVVDRSEPFARLLYLRRVKKDKDKEVFGPFVMGSHLSDVLKILVKSFRLRDCSLREFQARKEPCLLYQMKQCSAPCVQKISTEEYNKDLEMAVNFFRGKGEATLQAISDRMNEAAQLEHFERAALLRDSLEVLRAFHEQSHQKNSELQLKVDDVDVVAMHKGELDLDIAIYIVRNGLLLGHKNFHLPLSELEDEMEDEMEEEVSRFLIQYYLDGHDSHPKKIVTPFRAELNATLTEALKIKFSGAGKELKSMLDLAQQQAQEHQRFRLTNQESVYTGLHRLKELLELKERPRILECFDVAVFQGSSPTAAQIVFHDGKPEKSAYRHYHLEERPEGNNDFAMMKEMLERRLKHGNFPDVFIVDGGKGQVSIFQGVLKELEIEIPVVGIAKAKNKGGGEKTEERLVIPGRINPYALSKNRSLFRIITSMRDEAHRFSRRLHHHQEKKRVVTSWFDQISGIGPVMRKRILSKLDRGPNEIKQMSVEEICEWLGVKREMAQKISEQVRLTF